MRVFFYEVQRSRMATTSHLPIGQSQYLQHTPASRDGIKLETQKLSRTKF
jgi:hypothetical protein